MKRRLFTILSHMTTKELFELNQSMEVPPKLVKAITAFPTVAVAQHCGRQVEVSPFDIYAMCPVCGTEFKLRSFSSVTEIQDVFDAVFEWLRSPDAQAVFRHRQQQIANDR